MRLPRPWGRRPPPPEADGARPGDEEPVDAADWSWPATDGLFGAVAARSRDRPPEREPDEASKAEPEDEPSRDRPPIDARTVQRRRLALLGLALLLFGAGFAAALLAASTDDAPSTKRVRLSPTRSTTQRPTPRRPRRAPTGVTPAVRRIVGGMSLSRQVAQLFLVGFDRQSLQDPFFGRLRQRDWGGVVLGRGTFADPAQLAALAGEVGVVAAQARHVAPLVAADQPGGPASAFPALPPAAQPLVGRDGRLGEARRQARDAAAALRQARISMTFAPVADVGTPGGPVEDRVYGDDAALVTRLVRASVAAYRRAGLVAAVGHFPGEGGASDDPDQATASVGLTLSDLRRRDLLPFAAVSRTAPVVIVSNAVYAAYDGATPAVLLPEVIGGLLRRGEHFDGVVMTDDLEATAPVAGVTLGAVAVGALRAGADLLYVSGRQPDAEQAYRAVLSAVRHRRISRARLRQSVLRIVALKRRFGVLGSAPKPPPEPKAKPAPRAKPKSKPKAKPSSKPQAKPGR